MNQNVSGKRLKVIALMLFCFSFNVFANTQADSLVKLGLLQVKLKKYSPAKATYLKAIRCYKESEDKKYLISVMNNIGLLEEAIKQNDSAMRYYRLGLSIAKDIPDSTILTGLILNTANLLVHQNKYSEAKLLIDNGILLSKKGGMADELIRGRQIMAKLLYKQGNYKDAFNYLSRSSRYYDSISIIRNSHFIDSIGEKYEIDSKEFKAQNAHQESVSKPFNQGAICFLIILVILIGMLATLFYIRNKNKDKIANLFNETNRQTEDQGNEIKSAIAIKDKFFSIIAHDLNVPFTAILGLADMLKEDYNTLDEKEKMLYIRAIHSSSFNTYELLKNLNDWSRSETGKIESKPALIDLDEMAEQHIQLFKSYAQNKDILLSMESQGQTTAFADRKMVSSIIRNLLNNAIKYTNRGGEVHVNILGTDIVVELSVTDIGVGLNEQNLKKLFNINESYRTKGTADESGTGLGLFLCKKFVAANNGAIRAESAPGKGSRFTITLPVNAPEKV
ncbi:MAG: tetratricopeptide repeat-containing sensor histidine kinase [Bacteroidales bacterium]